MKSQTLPLDRYLLRECLLCCHQLPPQASSLLSKTVVVSRIPAEPTGMKELWEDDLAGKVQNEYDPMVPNNYEMIMKQKRAEERRDNEVRITVLLISCFGFRRHFCLLCRLTLGAHAQ